MACKKTSHASNPKRFFFERPMGSGHYLE